jgi:hypothetical protein
MREKSEEEVAVGEDNDKTDWKLNPLSHAEKLPSKAAPLRRVLETPEIRGVIERYQKSDVLANAAQRHYKRAAHLRLYAGVLATIIGAALLLPIENWVDNAGRNIPAAAQYACLCLSFIAALWLARALPFDSWMKARAEAEDARIDLFRRVMNAADPAPQPGADELKLLALKLEYFRRYQLDVQRRYYDGRGKQHEQAAGWTQRWWITSILLSGVAGAVALIAGLQVVIEAGHVSAPAWLKAVNDAIHPYLPPWVSRAELALGVIASALLSTSTSRSLMDLDERNASRYAVMAKNLDYYAGKELDEARRQAAAGQDASVRHYVEQVQDLLSGEHRQWILLAPVGGSTG